MTDLDSLRTGLAELADQVEAVDLRDRAVTTSRRMAANRVAAISAATTLTAAAVASLMLTSGGHRPDAGVTPTPPTGLSETALPAPPPEAEPAYGPFRGATITVPSWGDAPACPTGRVKLSPAAQYDRGPATPILNVLKYVTVDVDGDGAKDYVAILQCGEGDPRGVQVVAFRAGDAGELLPIGRVVGTQDGVGWILGLTAEPLGRVTVEVTDKYTDGNWGSVQHQRRTYSWRNGRFVQDLGPRSFPSDPAAANLVLTATDLIFTRASDGRYAGRMDVTVHNWGNADVVRPVLTLLLPREVGPAGGEWTGCTIQRFDGADAATRLTCQLGRLPQRATVTLQLEFVADDRPTIRDDEIGPRNHSAQIGQAPPYTLERSSDFTETTIKILLP